MSLIDQRILIEAPAEAIWKFLSDPVLMSKWNRAYKQIQVITTKATGTNARRRSILDNGKTIVEEITTWLDNIGYEYTMIDGPYQQFRGRFRLQGIPDGTIVNWTIEYQLKGPLGGLVNVTTYKRRQEDLMAESLRLLRRAVESSGVKLSPEDHARFAMQSAPNADSRASRIQQMIEQMPDQPLTGQTGAMKAVTISEDDLPEIPAQPIQPAASSAPTPLATRLPAAPKPTNTVPDTGNFVPSFAAEPDATAHTPTAQENVGKAATSDTKPRAPQGLKETIASQSRPGSSQENQVSEETTQDEPIFSGPTVPISLVAPPREPEQQPDTQTVNITPPEGSKPVTPPTPNTFPILAPASMTPPDTLPERIPTSPMKPIDREQLDRDNLEPKSQSSQDTPKQPSDPDARDTKDVSIWDVFGMERPSDRNKEELEAVVASIQRRALQEPESTEAQSTQPLALPRIELPSLPVLPLFGRKSSKRGKVTMPIRMARAKQKATLRGKTTVKVRAAKR